MSDFPHLTRAPITEAVVDIKVDPGPGDFPGRLADFRPRVATLFPDEQPIFRDRVTFGVNVATSTMRDPMGSIFWSPSKTRAVQARPDGFSVNFVSDYTNWADLKAEAQRFWTEYVAAVQPARVVRCALRYINRLEVTRGDDLQHHLLTRPELGAALPKQIEEYIMRVVVPFPPRAHAAIMQTALPASPGETSATKRTVVLDIDAFVDAILPPDSTEIWSEFENLREIKNQCFFRSLQDATWKAYR